MKRAFPTIVFSILFFSSCNQFTKDGETKSKVEQWMKEHLNNPKSYEPVEFGQLTPHYYCDVYKDTVIIHILRTQVLSDSESLSYSVNYLKSDSNSIKSAQAQLEEAKIRLSDYENERNKHLHDSTVINYNMEHKFRATNKMGGIVTETYTMVLDTNFNVVDGAVSEK